MNTCSDSSSDEEAEIVNNTTYIKIIPTHWKVFKPTSLNHHLFNYIEHTRLNTQYTLTNMNETTLPHYLNKSLIIDIPNTFFLNDVIKGRDTIYWEFLYDKHTIEYDIEGRNIVQSRKNAQEILHIINMN